MNLFKKIVIGFVFYTFPLAIVGFLIIALYEKSIIPHIKPYINGLYLLTLVHATFWTLTSLFLSISMFFSRSIRDSILLKVTGIKERDEREVQIAGKAFKSSYLTTVTILLFLFVISLFRLEVGEKSADSVEAGEHRRYVAIGLTFKSFDSDGIVTQKEGYDSYFHINFMPISVQALIILLLLWQTISYRFIVRRSFKIPD